MKKTIYKINSTKVVEAKSILIIIIINLKKAQFLKSNINTTYTDNLLVLFTNSDFDNNGTLVTILYLVDN